MNETAGISRMVYLNEFCKAQKFEHIRLTVTQLASSHENQMNHTQRIIRSYPYTHPFANAGLALVRWSKKT